MFMEGKHIGPAPNWYCNQISDVSQDGILAYGAQASLVLIDIKAEPPIYKLIQPIHDARIVAIVFCREPGFTNILATGSQDKTIKVWDIKNVPNELTLLYELEWRSKILSFDWQMKNCKDTMFVIDEAGLLFIWKLNTNKTTIVKMKTRLHPLIVSACPYNPNKVVLGYKGGTIAFVNAFRPAERHILLKGHDDDISSICWPPYIPSADESKQDWSNTLDLASTSRDRTLKVWNLKRQKCLKTTKPPPVGKLHGKQEVSSDKRATFFAANWNPSSLNQIICSSPHGELFLAVIKMDNASHWGVHWEKFEGRTNGEHNRCVFNISTFGSNTACTVSLDRQIILWDLKKIKSTNTLPTIGGFAYCLSFSPVDSSRLALGGGDMLIRTWNTSSVTGYASNAFWQGIRGKVTQLTWHPEKENLLGYGTEDGRVGVFDVLSNNKAIVSSTHHQSQVYSLCWGPFSSQTVEASNENIKSWFLYSCGDGKILIHNMKKAESDPVDIDKIIDSDEDSDNVKKHFRTEIAWKPDWTLVAIGNKDGTVNVYSEQFKLLATLSGQTKLITNLKWHPLYTTLSPETSDKHTWLACSSYENVIQIYELDNVYQKTKGELAEDNTPAVITTSYKQLAGHRNKVLYLSWSPHSEGKLASGSFDGSFQIWDVINGMPLVNYSGHFGMVFCVEWSPLDPDIVFSGSEDCSIHQIHVSKLVDKLPPPSKKSIIVKAETALTTKAKGDGQSVTDELDSEFDQLMAQLERKRSEITEDISPNVETTSITKIEKVEKLKKKAPIKTYFPLSNKLENQTKSVVLSDIQTMSTNLSETNVEKLSYSENSFYLAPFQDYPQVVDLVKAERSNHEENGNVECSYHMGVWTGDIKATVTNAIQKKCLDDYLVSIAMLESRSLWIEACEKYAEQLNEEGSYFNVNKAVSYLLASHKVLEAIELLKYRGWFKEALTIAKLRLPPSSPVFKELYTLFAHRCEQDTRFELAAKCYLTLNDFESAARILSNRMDPVSLKVACHIAATHNLKEAAEGYASKCTQRSLLKNNYEIVEQLVKEQVDLNVIENVQAILLLSCLHKLLIKGTEERGKAGVTNPLRQILIELDSDDEIEIWRSLLFEVDFYSFVDLEWQLIIPEFDKSRNELLQCIKKLFSQNKNALNRTEVFNKFAVDLTMSELSSDDNECFSHICNVLFDAYNLQPQFNLLREIWFLLVPKVLGCFDTKDMSLIKGVYSLSSISDMCYTECSPRASCCAFFFSSFLDQLYGQATNLNWTMLNHIHEEEEELNVDVLGCLINLESEADVTPSLIPLVGHGTKDEINGTLGDTTTVDVPEGLTTDSKETLGSTAAASENEEVSRLIAEIVTDIELQETQTPVLEKEVVVDENSSLFVEGNASLEVEGVEQQETVTQEEFKVSEETSCPKDVEGISLSLKGNKEIPSSPQEMLLSTKDGTEMPLSPEEISLSPKSNEEVQTSLKGEDEIPSSAQSNEENQLSPQCNEENQLSPQCNEENPLPPKDNEKLPSSTEEISPSTNANEQIPLSPKSNEETPSPQKEVKKSPSLLMDVPKTPLSPKTILSPSREVATPPKPTTLAKRNPTKVMSESKCDEVMKRLRDFFLIIVKGLSNPTFKQKQKLVKELHLVDTALSSATAKQISSLESPIIELQMARQNILHSLEKNHQNTQDLLYPDFGRSLEVIEKVFKELKTKVICAKAKEAVCQLEIDIRDLLTF